MELSVSYGAAWHWLFPLEYSIMLRFLYMSERDVKSVVVRCKFYSNSKQHPFIITFTEWLSFWVIQMCFPDFYIKECRMQPPSRGWWGYLVTSSRATCVASNGKWVCSAVSWGVWGVDLVPHHLQENAFSNKGINKSSIVMALRVGLHSKVWTPTRHSQVEMIIVWVSTAIFCLFDLWRGLGDINSSIVSLLFIKILYL